VNPHDRERAGLRRLVADRQNRSIADACANRRRAPTFLRNRKSAMEQRMFCAYMEPDATTASIAFSRYVNRISRWVDGYMNGG
jgi:hypothetical protein